MKFLSPKQTHAFRFSLVLILLASIVVAPASPSHAQRRRKPSLTSQPLPESGASAAQQTEAADKLAAANRWAEAIDAYKLVIRLHPKHGPAYKGLGDAYLNTGKSEQALASYKEAVRVAPNDAEAWYDLGYWYNHMGRHGEAFDPLVKATGLDPTFAEAFYGIGYAYQRGSEIDKAITWFKRAINANPNYAEAYYGLALVHTRLRQLNLAEEAGKKLLALDSALARKLAKEIGSLQRAAMPLPEIIPEEVLNQTQSKIGAATQPPRSGTATQTRAEEVLTSPTTTSNATPGVGNPPISDEGASTSLPQPTAETARQGNATTSPELFQTETVPSAQTPVAPATNVSNTAQTVQLDGATQPAPAEAKAQPAASGPLTAWPAKAKRWALVIGVDNYSEEQSSNFHGPANDARTLAGALVQYAGFPSDQVILLSSDQPLQLQPSGKAIAQSLTGLQGRVPEDGLLLVSFAGHGIDHNGRPYLLPSDAPKLDDLSLLEYTAVSVERLKELIRKTGVKQVVLIVDASKNDPAPGRQGSDNPMTSAFGSSFKFDLNRREVTSFATLYATAVGQRAYEYRAKKQGYFTWALVEGLRGEAANDKGEVTLAGLVKYVQDTVPKYVQRDLGAEKQQAPFAVIEGYKADELVIATVSKKAP